MVSPPNVASRASATTSAIIASPTTAARGRIATSLRSMCARPAWPVARSTESSGLRSVATGLTAARTTMASPLLMPPSTPPARFVRRPHEARAGSTSSWTALPRRARTPKPSPISTPLTAWMPMVAAASAVSRRVSHSALEPTPMGIPSTTTTKLPPMESPASMTASTSLIMAASATGSGQRSGVGSRRSRCHQPSADAVERVVHVGERADGSQLVDEAPDRHAGRCEELPAHGARRDARRRRARRGTLEDLPDIGRVVLDGAREVGVAGAGEGDRLGLPGARDGLDRHPLVPALPVQVRDGEREG